MAVETSKLVICYLLILVLTILSRTETSLGRPFNVVPNTDDGGVAAAIEPQLNLKLPTDEKDEPKDVHVHAAMPCDMDSSNTKILRNKKLAGKFGPLVLNVLPKGSIPPSGPSKGTNDLNN